MPNTCRLRSEHGLACLVSLICDNQSKFFKRTCATCIGRVALWFALGPHRFGALGIRRLHRSPCVRDQRGGLIMQLATIRVGAP